MKYSNCEWFVKEDKSKGINFEDLARCWCILVSRMDNLESKMSLMEKTPKELISIKDKILNPVLLDLLETSKEILANSFKHLREATEGEFRTDKLNHDEESRKYYSGLALGEVEEVEKNVNNAIDILVDIRKSVIDNGIQ